MKLAIVGSRTFTDFDYFEKELLEKIKASDVEYIISGGANGVDTLAELFAKKHGIKMVVYKPDWNKYGKKAGYMRNVDIISECDNCIAFWDGKSPGTKHSIDIAKKQQKNLEICKI